jgi:hypothetical protein
MKIYIGPYKNWFGPYQLAEKIMFWRDRNDQQVHEFGNFLATGSFKDGDEGKKIVDFSEDENETLLYKFLKWVDSKKKRTVKIKIHDYDVWNMDSTLALIALPMLKILKEKKHGSPLVDDADVPEHLRSTAAPPLTEEQVGSGHTDDNFHRRWGWVLDEIIWTFEQLQPDCDWEEQYYTGVAHYVWEKVEGENLHEMKQGANHTQTFDAEGYRVHADRIKRGLTLFGKYYQGLWD